MYLVSACLGGVKCRYDGNNVPNEKIEELVRSGKAITICPEIIGGLEIPRECSEIVEVNGEKRVFSSSGKDITAEYAVGAEKTLEICRILGIKKAILKFRSPSCGFGKIYDGTFSGKLIPGNGITAELLIENGIEVISENDF